MSFRKRGEVINARDARVGPASDKSSSFQSVDAIGRPSLVTVNRSLRTGPRNHPGQTGLLNTRMGRLNIDDRSRRTEQQEDALNFLDLSHLGIRPSPVSSIQTTSTGSLHLDKILGHTGLPLGNSLLVEEQGTTDFSSMLCKLFASQGVVHNRKESSHNTTGNTHLIVLSLNEDFAKELPGVYKGSRKDMKKSKIAEEESKVTVQNLSEKANPSRYKDLKIAWRYKLNDEKEDEGNSSRKTFEDEKKHYNDQFDITTRLMPQPSSLEVTFISPLQPPQTALTQVEQVLKKHQKKLIRIIIPSLLHPAMYPPSMFRLGKIIPLVHGLRGLVKKYDKRCVLSASVSTDMLDDLLISQIENLFDSVITLEPFGQDMIQFLERAYRSQPNKVQHGLLHILKLPVFSERGEMHVLKSSYAFKNSKRKFEIEEWGIPVDDVGDNNDKDVSSEEPRNSTEQKIESTKISLDF